MSCSLSAFTKVKETTACVPLPLVVTVTVASSKAVAPPLSVAVSLNTYTPATRLLKESVAVPELVIVAEGPLCFVHNNEAMLPPGSLAEPVSVVLFAGNVKDLSAPALTTGGVLDVFSTTLKDTVSAAPAVPVPFDEP